MKNRTWLIGNNEYDMLCRMNASLMRTGASYGVGDDEEPVPACIMNCFMSEQKAADRCGFASCEDCIASFLNEEMG